MAAAAVATVEPLVLVPVGSLEQHGPHLPLDTDTVIAEAVARGLAVALAPAAADRLGRACWVAPPIAYGSSGEHQSFAGTVSIGAEALRHTVVELVRSLSTWAGPVVLVNGHGGNVPALSSAVEQMVVEGHDVTWVPCAPLATVSAPGQDSPHDPGAGSHAGRTETSLMLHLRPESVRMDLAEVGDLRPLGEILPIMRAGGVAAVSPLGVLGDPTAATAIEGERLLGEMVAALADRLAGSSAQGAPA